MKRNGNAASSVESGGNDDLFRVDGNLGVLHDGIEHVGRDLGVVVPVAGVVAQSGEHELRSARAGRPRRRLAAAPARRAGPEERPPLPPPRPVRRNSRRLVMSDDRYTADDLAASRSSLGLSS